MEIKDVVFKDPITQSSDFKFDKKVVTVFDDMVTRSVPYYLEIQRMIAELAAEYARSGTAIYDLGCSTGTTLKNMDSTVTTKKNNFLTFREASIFALQLSLASSLEVYSSALYSK